MLTKVQKWGNSQGVRVPLKLLEVAKIALGDEVDVSVREGQLVISPSQRSRGRYRLEDLLAQMPADYEPVEEDWVLQWAARSGRCGWCGRALAFLGTRYFWWCV